MGGQIGEDLGTLAAVTTRRSAGGPWQDVASFEVLLPVGVDLIVLNDAPLELAGRIAVHGQIIFDDDPFASLDFS